VSGLYRKGPPESQGWRVETAVGDGVDADVVIDASGRGSRLPAWLAALAGSPPKVSEVDARIARSRRRRLYRPMHALRRRGGVPRAVNRRHQAAVGQWRPVSRNDGYDPARAKAGLKVTLHDLRATWASPPIGAEHTPVVPSLAG